MFSQTDIAHRNLELIANSYDYATFGCSVQLGDSQRTHLCSTGQNAFEQAKQFTKATQVSSLAITKLDGTAKGGVVIGISDQFKIPVRYIGLGEQMTDLQVFDREEFVKSLLG